MKMLASAMRLAAFASALATFVDGATTVAQQTGTPAGPAWLRLAAGTAARVDVAPWPVYDEPEAALTGSAASLERDFTADLARPNDVVYEPAGVRVRLVRVLAGNRIALVRAMAGDWVAYAPLDRVVPEVPAGTRLRVAGGFGGFADFSPALDAPEAQARPLATGTGLVALGMGTATAAGGDSDLVRVHVRVLAGPERGRTGWIPAAFTGIPLASPPPQSEEAVRACLCRLVRFEPGR
jgi:hypothetical protein